MGEISPSWKRIPLRPELDNVFDYLLIFYAASSLIILLIRDDDSSFGLKGATISLIRSAEQSPLRTVFLIVFGLAIHVVLNVMWLSLTDDEYARDNMYFILVKELEDEV